MRFSTLLFSAIAAFTSVVTADNPNAFNVNGTYGPMVAGQSWTFTWHNIEGSTVTLTLRDGASGNLNTGTTIASKISNTGSYTWQIPASTVSDNSYAVEIVNDDDTSETNYTPQFIIESNVVAVGVTGSTTGLFTNGLSTTATNVLSSTGTGAGTVTTATITTSGASGLTTATSTGTASGSSKTSSAAANTASTSSAPTPSAAAVAAAKVGGSLLAVALGFAVAL